MTNGNIWVFPVRLVCKAGWGFEGLSSLLLINNRVINQRGWDCDTETQTHKGTEWRLNMEPDTVSPYSSVISTVCRFLHYLWGGGWEECVGQVVSVCVLVQPVCSCVQKSIRINLYPQLFDHLPCLLLCLPPCYPVIAVLVGPFGHCVWVSLIWGDVKDRGSNWSD